MVKSWAVEEQHKPKEQTMCLLSHFQEGHWPMTVVVAETLEIMCNLIFTQIKGKYHNAWIMKSLLEKKEKSVPEDSLHFLSWAVHTMRFTHSADTRINSILAGRGRCSKVIAKCSCDSVLLSFIHYFTMSTPGDYCSLENCHHDLN